MDGLLMQVPSSGGGGSAITVQDEGVDQSTTVTTLNFTGAGVTASGGGATATINVGGGGSSSFTAATITIPYTNSQYAEATVVDAAITATDKILVSWGMLSEADENSPDMDNVSFYAIPATGSMTVKVTTPESHSRVGGTYKIMYMRG